MTAIQFPASPAVRRSQQFLIAAFVGLAASLSAHAQSTLSGTRASAFGYLSNGLLQSETIEPDSGNADYCVTTSYAYDVWGNKQSATTAGCAGASTPAQFQPRTSTSTFASQSGPVLIAGGSLNVPIPAGQYATTLTNALNQSETRRYDPRHGSLASLTGPNALTTIFIYDDFGRKVQEMRADGTSSFAYYCILSSSGLDASSNSDPNLCSGWLSHAASEVPAGAISFVHTVSRDSQGAAIGPASRIYKDRQGRTLRELSEAFDGTLQPAGRSILAKDTLYDRYGVAYLSTAPYFLGSLSSTVAGSNDVGLSLIKVDALGRTVQADTSDPQGGITGVTVPSPYPSSTMARTSVAYEGLKTTTTNPKGQTRAEEKNIDGKVVRVTDAFGGQIAHQHDAFGNLIQTRDALQNLLTLRYDIRGRKIGMDDPDTGTWAYSYNALGELAWQQSPVQRNAGTATTMAYDLLGRMSSRADPEYTSSWSYDSCSLGVGKLCASSTSHGVSKQVVYDALGRPKNSRTTLTDGSGQQRSFATAVSYDAVGRLQTQTYPTGVKMQYAYSGRGYLAQVLLATNATISPLPATLGGAPVAGKSVSAGTVLWSAGTVNAWGRSETQTLSDSGVSTRDTFEPATGRLLNTSAGIGSATNVLNQNYAWDSLGNLAARTDVNGDGNTGAVLESFVYDSINRLTSYQVSAPQIPNLARTVDLVYNAIGNLLYKSDVGNYEYPGLGNNGGTLNQRPHAVSRVVGTSFGTVDYSYDANGNLVSASGGKYRNISYTSFNLPDSNNGVGGPGGSPRYTWQYDENHQRIREIRSNSSGTRTTWSLHPDNLGGLSFESEEGPNQISNRHYVSAGSQTIVLVTTGALPTLAAGVTTPPSISSIVFVKEEYWHKDHLGSLTATTDHQGNVTARYAYDPFGKRRYTNGSYDAFGTLVIDWADNVNQGTDRGYTGHEHLDDIGVVHMNGRIFDPTIARFLQADPFIQDPGNLQSYNRYSYCYNNPLTCTDPSGYFADWFTKIIDPFGHGQKVARSEWGSTIGTIVIGVVSLYCGPYYALCVGAGNATQASFAGASAGQAIRTGVISGATAYAFNAVGDVTTPSAVDNYDGLVDVYAGSAARSTGDIAANVAGHAVVGGAAAYASGGSIRSGAWAAAFGATYSNFGSYSDDITVATMQHAFVGGIGSVLGGGKFANGAVTGAFGYLFNQAMHGGKVGGPRQPGWGYEYPDVDHPFAPNDEFKARFFGSEEERRVWFRTQEIAAGTAETREWLRFDDPKVQLPRSGGPLYQIFDLGLAEAGAVRIAYSPKFPNVFYVSLDHYQPTPAQPLRWTRFEAAPPKN